MVFRIFKDKFGKRRTGKIFKQKKRIIGKNCLVKKLMKKPGIGKRKELIGPKKAFPWSKVWLNKMENVVRIKNPF